MRVQIFVYLISSLGSITLPSKCKKEGEFGSLILKDRQISFSDFLVKEKSEILSPCLEQFIVEGD